VLRAFEGKDGFSIGEEMEGRMELDCEARDKVLARIFRTISFRSSRGGSFPASWNGVSLSSKSLVEGHQLEVIQ